MILSHRHHWRRSRADRLVGTDFADTMTARWQRRSLRPRRQRHPERRLRRRHHRRSEPGADTANYNYSWWAYFPSFAGRGTASGCRRQGHWLYGIESVSGSEHADELIGQKTAPQSLSGQGGHDILEGRGGAGYAFRRRRIRLGRLRASSAGVTVDVGTSVGTGGDDRSATASSASSAYSAHSSGFITGSSAGKTSCGASGRRHAARSSRREPLHANGG